MLRLGACRYVGGCRLKSKSPTATDATEAPCCKRMKPETSLEPRKEPDGLEFRV